MKTVDEFTTGIRLRSRSGYSLAEVVFALAIIGICMGMFAVTLGLSAKATNSARRQMTSMNYARLKLESLHSLGFNNTQLIAGTYSFSNVFYSGSYTVSTVTTNKVKQIRTKVNWVNAAAGNLDTNVTYTTLFSSAVH